MVHSTASRNKSLPKGRCIRNRKHSILKILNFGILLISWKKSSFEEGFRFYAPKSTCEKGTHKLKNQYEVIIRGLLHFFCKLEQNIFLFACECPHNLIIAQD
jgi:hypothetical protein